MAMKMGRGAAFGGSAIPSVTGSDNDVNGEINVTPMVDVMLVLLIIFMVTLPAMSGYTAVLPKAVTAAPEKDDRVTLGIDRQGRYYVEPESRPVAPEQLAQALSAAYATRPQDHILYLKADNQVEYSVVLTAIEAARQAGVIKIGAITELPKEQAERNAAAAGGN
jgi:biopolymer transport protein ExbD